MRPNIGAWFDDLRSRVYLKEAVFFADFSHQSLADEIKRIRPYSNKIIDTRNANGNVKKDFTDFIMLDNMYQKALSSDDIDVFILFSGDGHFSSVTSFLKNIYQKEVGIYGVKNSFSRQLQDTASWCVTMPFESEINDNYNRIILDGLNDYVRANPKKLPVMNELTTFISGKYNLSKSELQKAMQRLIDGGYLSQRAVGGKKEAALFVDWNSLETDNIYSKEKSRA